MEKNISLKEKIKELKYKRKAIILAHLYQIDEIQEVADYVGDSLGLSKNAAKTDAEIIVFCGVKFMAETAKILSPDKTVLLPVPEAGCFMAEMIAQEDVIKLKKEHPKAAVVCYVNSTAEVKAVSDYCCTSSNAVKLVSQIPEEEIIFIPDQNLGKYVAKQVPNKKFIFWQGYCPTHHRINVDEAERVKASRKDAEILAHPECRPEVLDHADFIGSTSEILQRAKESSAKTFSIGTEQGIFYQLKKDNPDKEFYLLSQKLICANMKKIKLEDLYESLNKMQYQIEVDNEIREKAIVALDRMMQYS